MESMGFFVKGGHVEGYDDKFDDFMPGALRTVRSIASEIQQVWADAFFRKQNEVIMSGLSQYLGRQATMDDAKDCRALVKTGEQIIYHGGVAFMMILDPELSSDGSMLSATCKYAMLAERAK